MTNLTDLTVTSLTADAASFGGTTTLSGGNGINILSLPDNLAAAWSVKEGSTNYIVIITTDASERVSFGVDLAMAEGVDINTGTTTGTKICTTASQKIAFYNATPVVQPAALTAQLTSITHTEPGTPDYAIQNLTQTTPFGFVTADEGNSVLKVISNLQTRVAEVEARLEALGLVASN